MMVAHGKFSRKPDVVMFPTVTSSLRQYVDKELFSPRNKCPIATLSRIRLSRSSIQLQKPLLVE